MNHVISVEDIKGYKFQSQIAGCFGKNTDKELLAVVTPETSEIEYQVVNAGSLVLSSNNLEEAILEYNKY